MDISFSPFFRIIINIGNTKPIYTKRGGNDVISSVLVSADREEPVAGLTLLDLSSQLTKATRNITEAREGCTKIPKE